MGTNSTGNSGADVLLCVCSMVSPEFVPKFELVSQIYVAGILIGITYLMRENGYHIWVDGENAREGTDSM